MLKYIKEIMIREKILSKSPQETIEIARKLVLSLEDRNINIFISGELGAGKTHFTKGIFQGLGISSEATSPTFDLLVSYETPDRFKVNHLDLYRLNILSFEDEVWLAEILEEKSLNVVEWADKFDLENIHKKCIYIKIEKLTNSLQNELGFEEVKEYLEDIERRNNLDKSSEQSFDEGFINDKEERIINIHIY
jgi:tRNA threonylcarbamoyladenosine biosynthesis protein TsaE